MDTFGISQSSSGGITDLICPNWKSCKHWNKMALATADMELELELSSVIVLCHKICIEHPARGDVYTTFAFESQRLSFYDELCKSCDIVLKLSSKSALERFERLVVLCMYCYNIASPLNGGTLRDLGSKCCLDILSRMTEGLELKQGVLSRGTIEKKGKEIRAQAEMSVLDIKRKMRCGCIEYLECRDGNWINFWNEFSMKSHYSGPVFKEKISGQNGKNVYICEAQLGTFTAKATSDIRKSHAKQLASQQLALSFFDNPHGADTCATVVEVANSCLVASMKDAEAHGGDDLNRVTFTDADVHPPYCFVVPSSVCTDNCAKECIRLRKLLIRSFYDLIENKVGECDDSQQHFDSQRYQKKIMNFLKQKCSPDVRKYFWSLSIDLAQALSRGGVFKIDGLEMPKAVVDFLTYQAPILVALLVADDEETMEAHMKMFSSKHIDKLEEGAHKVLGQVREILSDDKIRSIHLDAPSPIEITHNIDDAMGKIGEKFENIRVSLDPSDQFEKIADRLSNSHITVDIGEKAEVAMDKLTEQITAMQKIVGSLKDSLKNFFESGHMAKTACEMFEKILGTIVMIWGLTRMNNSSQRLILLTTWALTLGLTTNLVAGLASSIHTLTQLNKKVDGSMTAHGPTPLDEEFMSDAEVSNVFTPIVGVLWRMVTGSTMAERSLDRRRIKEFREYAGLLKDGSGLMKSLIGFTKSAFYWIYEKCTGQPFVEKELHDLVKETQDWVAESSKHLNADYAKNLPLAPDLAKDIIGHMKRGDEIGATLIGMELKGRFQPFFEVKSAFRRLHHYAHQALSIDNGRVVPTWIHIIGVPLTGKSVLGRTMVRDLMNLCKKKFRAGEIFCWTGISEYFEGYLAQFALIIDDIFQKDNEDERTDMAMGLISMVNDESFPLNMAALENKGSVFFTSPLIITSSNTMKFEGLNIKLANLDALKRRRSIVAQAFVEKSFIGKSATGQPLILAASPSDTSIYRFDVLDVMNESHVLIKGITYTQLLKLSFDQLQRRMSKGVSLNEFLFYSQPEEFLTEEEKEKAPGKIAVALASCRSAAQSTTSKMPDYEVVRTKDGPQLVKVGMEAHMKKIVVENGKDDEEKLEDNRGKAAEFVPLNEVDQAILVANEEARKEFEKSQRNSDLGKKMDEEKAKVKVHVDGVAQKIKATWKDLKEESKKHKGLLLSSLIGAIGIIGGAIALAAIAASHFADDEEEVGEEHSRKYEQTDARIRYSRNRGMKRAPAKYNPGDRFVAHSSIDPTSDALVDSLLSKNGFMLYQKGKGGVSFGMLRGCFISDLTFITVGHAFTPAVESVMFSTRRGDRIVKMEKIQFKINDSDIAIGVLPPGTFQPFPDISDHICTDKDLADLDPGEYIGCYTFGMPTGILRTGMNPKFVQKLSYNKDGKPFKKDIQGIVADFVSAKGECGSWFVFYNTKIVRKLCGIEVAGDAGRTAAAIVTIEMIEESGLYKKKKKLQVPFEMKPPEWKPEQKIEDVNPKLEAHGNEIVPLVDPGKNSEILFCVAPDRQVRLPSKSVIVPSLTYEMIQKHTMEPAKLRPYKKDGVLIKPMDQSLAKIDRTHIEYKSPWSDRVLQWMIDKQRCYFPAYTLNDHEALNGPKGAQHLHKIEIKHSLGYPEVLDKPANLKGKHWFVTVLETAEGPVYVPNELMKQKITIMEDGYLGKCETEMSLAMDCLKDELRPIGKRTRIFSAMNFKHTHIARKCMGAYMENRMRGYREGCCQMGINPHSNSDWMLLHERLTKFGNDKAAAGDVEACDSSITRLMFGDYKSYVDAWYKKFSEDKEDYEYGQKLRNGVFADANCAKHICVNTVYQVKGKNPSGWFGTTDLNTFVLEKTQRESVMEAACASDPKLEGEFEVLMEEMELAGFGDDGATGVSDRVSEFWNMRVYGNYLSKHGMVYTDFNKSDIMPEFYSFKDIQFLKRSFRKVGKFGICFAPLSKELINEMTNWCSTECLNIREATSIKNKVALDESAYWGPDYYEEMKEKINAAHHTVGLPPLTGDWYSWYHRYLGASQFQEAVAAGELMDAHGFMAPADAHAWSERTDLVIATYEAAKGPKKIDWDPEVERFCDQFADFEAHSMEMTAQDGAPTDRVEIVSFSDHSPSSDQKGEISANESLVHKGTSVYPDQGMTPPLQRVYPIDTFEWGGAQTRGTAIKVLDFPGMLLAIPQISEKLNRFRYLRTAVRVKVLFNSVPFQYGRLLVAWCPHFRAQSNNLNPFQSLYTASNLPHYCISPKSNSFCDFIIPFISPRDWYDLQDDPTTDGLGYIGKVYFYVEHPLSLQGSTSTPKCTITVFASFVDPKLEGFGLRVTPSAREKKLEKKVEELEEYVNMEAHSADLLLGKGPMGQGKSVGLDIQNSTKEAVTKTESGAMSVVKEHDFKFNANVAITPVGGGGLIGKVVGLIGGLIHKKKAKPSSVEIIHKNQIHQVSSLCLSNGLDGGEVLAMDPENQVATDHKIYDMAFDYDLFENYKHLPTLIFTGEWLTTNVPTDKLFVLGCHPMVCHQFTGVDDIMFEMTHVGHMAREFKFWRGGLNYCLDFVTSEFITARAQIIWNPDSTTTAVIADDQAGDTVGRIIDIRGDTRVLFCAPYNKPAPWLFTADMETVNVVPIVLDELFNGQIYVRVINPLNTNDSTGTVKIYMSLRVSGADNFEVAQPMAQDFEQTFEASGKYTDKTDGSQPSFDFSKMEAHSATETDMRKLFRSKFDALIPAKERYITGIQMGERVIRWSDLLKRFHRFDQNTALTTSYDPFLWSHNDLTTWHRVLRSFLFCRGSYRIKIIIDAASSEFLTVFGRLYDASNDLSSLNQAVHYVDGATRGQALEVQIPFYCNFNMMAQSFVGVTPECDYRPKFQYEISGRASTPTVGVEAWIAIGDDFSFGFPIGPTLVGCANGLIKKLKISVATNHEEKSSKSAFSFTKVPRSDKN